MNFPTISMQKFYTWKAGKRDKSNEIMSTNYLRKIKSINYCKITENPQSCQLGSLTGQNYFIRIFHNYFHIGITDVAIFELSFDEFISVNSVSMMFPLEIW